MKNLTFQSHVIPLSLTPDSIFVLTETSEEVFAAGAPGLSKYQAPGPSDSRAETAFWHAAGLDPRMAERRLRSARVGVRMLCGMRPDDLKEALRANGVRVGRPAALEIAVAEDYLDPRLADERPCPVLLVKPLGQTIWVGPLLRPGVTACAACLASALCENQPVRTQLERLGEVPSVWRAALPSTVDLAYSLAATEAALWIASGGSNPRVDGRLMAFDTLTHRFEGHVVRRLPKCENCGSRTPRTMRLVLAARKKAEAHRSVPLAEVHQAMNQLVSNITGIISAVDVIPNPYQPAVEIAAASYNLPLDCLRRQTAFVGRPEGGSGKGTSVKAAQVSAIGEAVERYSGIFRGGERRVHSRLADLEAPAFVPSELLLFSDEQYRQREAWNRRCRPIERVPEPFDSREAIDWTPVWSLTRKAIRYVPAAFCYFQYPDLAPWCQADSSGCAAGNNLEEAILHGFYELAERDAAGLWWYRRARRPGVDLAAFDLPVLDALRRNRRGVEVLDLTTDLGIPVYAAVTADAGGGQIAIGLSAHLDPKAAITGALADAVWQEAVVMHPSANVHPLTRRWLRRETLDRHPHLCASGKAPVRLSLAGRDIRGDLMTCVQAAERVGIEVLALDQTRGETGIAVARVIAPGLRHLWPRFAPGRMAALRGGWNPVPFPF